MATPAKKAPTKKAPTKRAPRKKVVNARDSQPAKPGGFTPSDEGLELPPETRHTGRVTPLEVRLGNRIVFLQEVLDYTYQMSFTGGVLQLQAQTEAGTPPPDPAPNPATHPASAEDYQDGPEDGEGGTEPHPDVNLQVHSGDRA